MSDLIINITDYSDIHSDIVQLLKSSRRAAVRSVNAVMTATYWEIGRRIVDFEQNGADRAEYGKALLKRLSIDLSVKFGRGFGVVNLQQMRLLYQTWPLNQIYQTLSDKSSPDGNYISPIRDFVDLSVLAKAFPLPWSGHWFSSIIHSSS